MHILFLEQFLVHMSFSVLPSHYHSVSLRQDLLWPVHSQPPISLQRKPQFSVALKQPQYPIGLTLSPSLVGGS